MRARLLCLWLLFPVLACAEEPRVEAGIGGLAMALPDYRGSDRYGNRLLPFPYLAYRTENVQLTREGFRARLLALDRVTASVSAAVTVPGNDDNPDRAGMPELAPTLEMGPSLDFLVTEQGEPLRVRLRLPARAVAAVDGIEFRDVGLVAVPHLRADYSSTAGSWELSHLVSLGAVWASEDYHEYFYGIAPEFATATRPAYDAHGGYSGARVTASSAARRGRWRYGVFASYDWLDGAAFADSPLVRTEHSGVAGIFITYRLYASGQGPGLESETP